MGKARTNRPPADKRDPGREKWLVRITRLVDQVEAWATELGWATRRIDKRMDDSDAGSYLAPGLLLQKEFTRVLLEPMGRSASGSGGVADLYLMPAYDNIARFFFRDKKWLVQHMYPGSPDTGNITDALRKPLDKGTFRGVLEQMTRYAEQIR